MNPLLLDFPDAFETKRMLIRCPRPGDGPVLNAAVIESLEQLQPWMPWADREPTQDESESVCRKGFANWLKREDMPLFLFLHDGTFVGGSGLHRMDWDVPKLEIGYWLHSAWQGQGLMTEAVRGVAEFAFVHLQAQRLEIRCDARNLRSKAVAERAGFAFESHLRREARDHFGQLRDTLIYAQLRDGETAV